VTVTVTVTDCDCDCVWSIVLYCLLPAVYLCMYVPICTVYVGVVLASGTY